ncbi:MAG: YifB family Mg chelatase-like AAA ATPase [Fusobacteriaceae bacterium]
MNLKVLSSSFIGMESYLVEVEIDIGTGMPNFSIIGLGDAAIIESKERVRTALKNSGYPVKPKKIVINLAPAAIRKEGAQFDLAIAIGLMVGFEFIKDPHKILERYLILGELSLNGKVNSVKGIIGASILAKELGFTGVIIPAENYEEASFILGVEIIPVATLKELKEFLETEENKNINIYKEKKISENNELDINFSEVKGQQLARRAAEIAAAGGHNVLMIGSPGSGKSMIAKRMPTIMPELSLDQKIECTKIYSIMGELKNNLITNPPFRAPHHTSSKISIIGGGRNVRAGEITLAHNGILFLDEFTEFPRDTLDSLRQPMEDKTVSISRVHEKITYPTKFQIILAGNPCFCGNLYDDKSLCTCSAVQIERYKQKFSGPLLDRIDLYIPIKKLDKKELLIEADEESSQLIKTRVENARKIQKDRYHSDTLNANMNQKEIKKFCKINEEDKDYMSNVIDKFQLSARSYDKVLKVARTIADLEKLDNISRTHILEAISYRKKN